MRVVCALLLLMVVCMQMVSAQNLLLNGSGDEGPTFPDWTIVSGTWSTTSVTQNPSDGSGMFVPRGNGALNVIEQETLLEDYAGQSARYSITGLVYSVTSEVDLTVTIKLENWDRFIPINRVMYDGSETLNSFTSRSVDVCVGSGFRYLTTTISVDATNYSSGDIRAYVDQLELEYLGECDSDPTQNDFNMCANNYCGGLVCDQEPDAITATCTATCESSGFGEWSSCEGGCDGTRSQTKSLTIGALERNVEPLLDISGSTCQSSSTRASNTCTRSLDGNPNNHFSAATDDTEPTVQFLMEQPLEPISRVRVFRSASGTFNLYNIVIDVIDDFDAGAIGSDFTGGQVIYSSGHLNQDNAGNGLVNEDYVEFILPTPIIAQLIRVRKIVGYEDATFSFRRIEMYTTNAACDPEYPLYATESCICPKDCELDEWSGWSECTCDGSQWRTTTILYQPTGHPDLGAACPDEAGLNQTQVCEAPSSCNPTPTPSPVPSPTPSPTPTPTPINPTPTPTPTNVTSSPEPSTDSSAVDDSFDPFSVGTGGSVVILILIILVVLGLIGGLAFYFLKVRKPEGNDEFFLQDAN
eukprot:TRINITY_DN8645_c0_g1_i1.p1 TRINITY_DN8645_c0_g1~~TRINITY_DN8645_c0_g1_i1.p1  ORF type:complete len:616 (+),score=114.42 TRINITY_DN8645_c0_g1_i1:100-1848(+)